MGKKGKKKGTTLNNAAPGTADDGDDDNEEGVIEPVEESNVLNQEESKENQNEENQSAKRKDGGEETLDDLQERHRNEMKEMKNQCQKLKKQVTQGDKKKKKEVQVEIERLEAEIAQRHQNELNALRQKLGSLNIGKEEAHRGHGTDEDNAKDHDEGDNEDEGHEENGRNMTKNQRRKNKKAEKMNELRRQAEEEAAQQPNRKENEDKEIKAMCEKLGLAVKQIKPDGNCLYNAVADQLKQEAQESNGKYISIDCFELRKMVAQHLRKNPDDYLPFLTNDNGDIFDMEDYKTYCDNVEKTAEWGGQLEIQALSKSLEYPIHVVQAGLNDVLKIGEEFAPQKKSLFLSYHRHAYGLGEHYNSLVPPHLLEQAQEQSA